MTLQLLHSEFPYKWGKFDFLFYQCGVVDTRGQFTVSLVSLQSMQISGKIVIRHLLLTTAVNLLMVSPTLRYSSPRLCCWHQRYSLNCKDHCEFRSHWKWRNWDYQRPGEEDSRQKPDVKISWHCPCNPVQQLSDLALCWRVYCSLCERKKNAKRIPGVAGQQTKSIATERNSVVSLSPIYRLCVEGGVSE
jgi:hypothetical protein